jgi:hypothetical protein
MNRGNYRLNVTLDEADPNPRQIALLLDAIPGAWERAQLGLRQSDSGETVPLDEM